MKANIFSAIRKIVSQVPKGKVTTYGLVAQVCKINDARVVGWAIWGNKNPKIPCHRIINREGCLAEKFSLGGWKEQKRRLQKEGVKFSKEKKVDLEKYLFVPKLTV